MSKCLSWILSILFEILFGVWLFFKMNLLPLFVYLAFLPVYILIKVIVPKKSHQS